MVRASTAAKNNYQCPACGDDLNQDVSGRGYVAHRTNRECAFEKGERDHSSLCMNPQRIRPEDATEHAPTDDVRLWGYSERGVLSSLLFEIGYSADPEAEVAALLSLVTVPGSAPDFSGILGAEILVEQSLSDFGDADAILLLHGNAWRRAVFIEAKVNPYRSKKWKIQAPWEEFISRKGAKISSSNLFTQLYHKVRFVSELRQGGVAGLVNGTHFPQWSTKTHRRLGDNPVVHRVAQMVKAYTDETIYVAVVPDCIENLADFFSNELRDGPPIDVDGWNTRGWGFLTWEQVEHHCVQRGLSNTCRVFEFNQGQVYRTSSERF